MRTALHRYGNPHNTPQTQGLRGQVPNSAGGFVFPLDRWKRLRRFLIMGTDGGTYYIRERDLTRENVETLEECADEDPVRVLNEIANVSRGRLAPKSEYAIFALAYMTAHPNEQIRRQATGMISTVCNIGTHLFQFAEFVEMFRGWGSALRKGVADWYLNRTPRQLAYQVTKYQQRNGWSHRDLLRLSHPKAHNEEVNNILKYTTQGVTFFNVAENENGELPKNAGLNYIYAVEAAKTATKELTIELIKQHGLTREMVNTEHLADVDVQKALVKQMPVTALVRNLGNLTRLGVFNNWSTELADVCQRLMDERIIKQSGIHPVTVLNALKTYESGGGFRGRNTWVPDADILAALNRTFRLAFKNVEPSNSHTLIGLDVSGSMSFTAPAGFDNLSCAEAAAAMLMATYETEPFVRVVGFERGLVPLPFTRGMDLRSVLEITERRTFGGTDCSLPMTYALHEGLDIDTFVVYTDNETWAGHAHPHIALQEYRNKKQKPDAKLIVVGMASNNFSIADPSDEGMLDVVGFDSSAPQIIAQFAKGEL